MKSALACRTCFSVCFLTGVMWAATPPDLRFRREHLPATTVDQVLTKFGLERNSAQGSSIGTINRVQYRFSAAPSGETLIVEREAVADPDPQKGTAARPRTEQGGRWFRENIPAPHGSQALSWGDFENDGSDELLAGWPLQVFKRESSGRWVELNSNLKLPRSQRALAIDLNHD